jgi:DNA-binding response OmpR family regulator
MIVEDEAIIAFSLEDGLTDAGFEVVGPFSACADALTSLAGNVPDIAILDAVLSDGTCLDLARELRLRGVPFVVYSGASEFREHAPELQGTPWVEKPAPFEVVLACARKLLGG